MTNVVSSLFGGAPKVKRNKALEAEQLRQLQKERSKSAELEAERDRKMNVSGGGRRGRSLLEYARNRGSSVTGG